MAILQNMSIRNKLLAVILAVTILMISGVAGLSYRISSKNILQQNEEQMARIVNKCLADLQFWLDERVREATLLSQDKLLLEAFEGSGLDEVRQRLVSYHQQSLMYQAIFLADASGVLMMNTNQNKSVGFDLSKTSEYAINVTKARQKLVWVGNVGKSPDTGSPVFLITAPILSGDKLIGILGMPVELNVFNDNMISHQNFGETGYMAIMNKEGVFLAHPDKKLILEASIADFEFGKKMLALKNGRMSYLWKGKEKFAEFRTLPEKNWLIVAAIEKADLLSMVNRMKWLSLMLGLAGVFFISFFTWLIIKKSLVKPLDKVVVFVEKVSSGDLSETLKNMGKNELGVLVDSMNQMVVDLRDVVSRVQIGADNVSAGSQELSKSSELMSQGASEQAASAEQVSASIEEMSANIRQNADNAFQTGKIAQTSAREAAEGGQTVIETVAAMKDIAEKITIIEEIARRIDLLALNAAIEAARAGEHGRGFAVVASEVRKLSEKTQTSAAHISQLSRSSVEVAEKSGEILNRIVPSIQKTAELVEEISAASSEQNSGTEQISQAVQQLDQVIQQNVSASEEMASTSEELSGQVEHLRSAIAYFKIRSAAMDAETGWNTSSSAAEEASDEAEW